MEEKENRKTNKMRNNYTDIQCPINFGDCPDCIHYEAGECNFKEEEE